MRNIREVLISARLGVAMGSKLFWGTLSAIAVLAWIWSLITDNPMWTIPAWLYIVSLLVALSIGLTPYMGQTQRTKQMENWGKGLEEDMQQARDKIEQLEKRIRELSCPPSSTIRKEPL